ncbi:MAG TPA: fibronectin type III domain-containing protein [Candidatus Limnocylindrales bacterium]|nr:fibronectin type III domain-containing protein [Candidatus Limnocylindrales bacterium]
MERKPATTAPVKDLALSQSGDTVILTFTLPKETLTRHPLKEPPAIEIFRNFSPAPPGPTAATPPSAQLIVTIPPELVAQYSPQGRFRYADSLTAEDLSRHAGNEAVYFVRTRLSSKRASENSNLSSVRVYLVPEPIADLQAEVTHSAVVLKWTPPQKSLVGPAPPIANYEIFRQAEEPAPAPTVAAPPPGEKPKSKPAPAKIGESAEPSFRDTQFEFGKTYIYTVRSIIQIPDGTRASADSNAVVVSPKDIFPPSAPQGLVIVFVAANAQVPAHLELSWAINPETDIAGYNVYRSEQEGTRGERLNSALLLTPAFRDMTALPGRRYFYSVTAVDTAGNESAAGAPASAGIPGENPAP